ncbi:MAG: ComEC/Rec2 family competence protein, partial [Pseudomonadota bacterium]
VGLLLSPVTVWVFGELHWVSPVANGLLVPLFGVLVVPLVLFAVAVMPVAPAVTTAVCSVVDGLLGGCLAGVSSLLDAVPSGLPTPVTGAAVLALGCAAALALLPRTWPCAGGALLAAVLTAFSVLPARPPGGHLRVTALDVGHGLALVLETATRTLVYDTGPRRGRFDAGAQLVAPAVFAGGRRRVDRLAVSHADSDHAGGVAGLLATLPVDRVMRPEDASCRAGVNWVWDGVVFQVLHPTDADRGHENDRSCVIRVTVPGGQSLLLLGDVERRGERALLRRGLAATTVMTVPHHGSATSSSEALLDALVPSLAINSHARGGRFQLPHARILQRYRARGIPLIGTAQHGALRFHLPFENPAEPRWQSARATRRWLWHRRAADAR